MKVLFLTVLIPCYRKVFALQISTSSKCFQRSTIHSTASKRSNDHLTFDRASFLKTNVSAMLITLTIPGSSNAMYLDPNTKILLPEEGEIEVAIPTSWNEEDDPFPNFNKSSFARLDSQPDTIFYQDPRFTEHVDENAVKIMTSYISSVLRPNDTVLDLCSSWTSHIDASVLEKISKVSGLGLNEEELKRNPCLSDYVVQDLNASKDLKLPYEDGQFDVVLCQLSIDYMIYPKELLREVCRVLKSGGRVHILFSNRLFIQKAVGLWTGKDDLDHAYTVGSYLHYSKGGFVDIHAKDLSTRKKGKIVGDPMYVVVGTNM
jgi:SAM-dependent methyltransferase